MSLMLLILIHILVVLVAKGAAASLGAPTADSSVETDLTLLSSTALHAQTVPLPQDTEKTRRKVLPNMPEQMFPKGVQDKENQVKILAHLSESSNSQISDSDALSPVNSAQYNVKDRTTSTRFDLQSSTVQERSLKELLNLARLKYLGHGLGGSQNMTKTRKPKSRTRLNNRRKTIIEMNKKRRVLNNVRFVSNRVNTNKHIAQLQNNTKNYNTTAELEEQKSDILSNHTLVTDLYTHISTSDKSLSGQLHLELNSADQPSIATNIEEISSMKTPHHFISLPNNSTPGEISKKPIDAFQLMIGDEVKSSVNLHNGRSLIHRPKIQDIKNIVHSPERRVFKHAETVTLLASLVQSTEDLPTTQSAIDQKESVTTIPFYDSSDTYESEEGSSEGEMRILDGQYHEVGPGQYRETNPGQYHEVNPGQYYELNPGQYHETNPGQYYDINPGQEVQLNIEFNPEEETKTYNVHKKTGDYIIGEVGKININDGQTLEGVRYTAVDGMVNQAQIAEILKQFFGTKTY